MVSASPTHSVVLDANAVVATKCQSMTEVATRAITVKILDTPHCSVPRLAPRLTCMMACTRRPLATAMVGCSQLSLSSSRTAAMAPLSELSIVTSRAGCKEEPHHKPLAAVRLFLGEGHKPLS